LPFSAPVDGLLIHCSVEKNLYNPLFLLFLFSTGLGAPASLARRRPPRTTLHRPSGAFTGKPPRGRNQPRAADPLADNFSAKDKHAIRIRRKIAAGLAREWFGGQLIRAKRPTNQENSSA